MENTNTPSRATTLIHADQNEVRAVRKQNRKAVHLRLSIALYPTRLFGRSKGFRRYSEPITRVHMYPNIQSMSGEYTWKMQHVNFRLCAIRHSAMCPTLRFDDMDFDILPAHLLFYSFWILILLFSNIRNSLHLIGQALVGYTYFQRSG